MLNTYGYRPDSGFIGIPKQIVDALKDTQVSVDTQTETLKAQTEAIETQTIVQHQDSVALKQEQAETRNSLTGLFGALAKTFKNIFTTDKGDMDGETFYEMVQRENNETQEYMAAHTETMANSLEINAEVLKDAIEASTSGGTVNFNNLIETLRQNGESLNSALTDDVVDAIRNEIINSGSF
jgi:hypothetical protein